MCSPGKDCILVPAQCLVQEQIVSLVAWFQSRDRFYPGSSSVCGPGTNCILVPGQCLVQEQIVSLVAWFQSRDRFYPGSSSACGPGTDCILCSMVPYPWTDCIMVPAQDVVQEQKVFLVAWFQLNV